MPVRATWDPVENATGYRGRVVVDHASPATADQTSNIDTADTEHQFDEAADLQYGDQLSAEVRATAPGYLDSNTATDELTVNSAPQMLGRAVTRLVGSTGDEVLTIARATFDAAAAASQVRDEAPDALTLTVVASSHPSAITLATAGDPPVTTLTFANPGGLTAGTLMECTVRAMDEHGETDEADFTVTVAADPCAGLSVDVAAIADRSIDAGSAATSIPLVVTTGGNAGTPALSVARTSGSEDIGATIVGAAVRVTVPSAEAATARTATFSVTAAVVCSADATETATDTESFIVTVPASTLGVPSIRAWDDVATIAYTITAPATGPTPVGYDVQHAGDAAFTNPTTSTAPHPPGDPTGSLLRIEGTRYIRCRAWHGGAMYSPWSDAVSIVIGPSVGTPQAPGLTVAETMAGIQATVTAPSSGPTPQGYQLERTNSDYTTAQGVPVFLGAAGAHTFTGLPAGPYYFRCRSYNQLGNSMWVTAAINTRAAPMVTYDPASPMAGDTITATLSYTLGTSDYQWQTRASSSATISDVAGATTTSFTVPDDAAGGRQYRFCWRRAVVGNEYGQWVTVDAPPPPPPAGVPGLTVRHTGGNTATATVTAPSSLPAPTGYEIQQALAADFSGAVATQRLTAPGDSVFSLSWGMADATWYFRARSTHADGNSDWTATVTLQPLPTVTMVAVTYSPATEVAQGESVTATLPSGATAILWQGINSQGAWQSYPSDRQSGTATFDVGELAVGQMLRVTWTAGGAMYAASNSVTVTPAPLDAMDMPEDLSVGAIVYDEDNPAASYFVARWDFPLGATEYQMEVERAATTHGGAYLPEETSRDSSWSSRAAIYDSGQFDGVVNGVTVGYFVPGGLTGADRTVYRWRVRARNVAGTSGWSDWEWVFYHDAATVAPATPAVAVSRTTNALTARWSGVGYADGADWVEAEVRQEARDEEGNVIHATVADTLVASTLTAWQFADLAPGIYSVRVRARNTHGWSGYGTTPDIIVPDLTIPAVTASVSGDDVVTRIFAPVLGAPTLYRVQRSTSSGFSSVAEALTRTTPGTLTFQDVGYRRHYFRGRGEGGSDGPTEWSPTVSVLVPPRLTNLRWLVCDFTFEGETGAYLIAEWDFSGTATDTTGGRLYYTLANGTERLYVTLSAADVVRGNLGSLPDLPFDASQRENLGRNAGSVRMEADWSLGTITASGRWGGVDCLGV